MVVNLCQEPEDIKAMIGRSLKITPKNIVRTLAEWNGGRSFLNNQSYSETWNFGFSNFTVFEDGSGLEGDTLFYGNIWGTVANTNSFADNYNFIFQARPIERFALPIPPFNVNWQEREYIVFARGSAGGVGSSYFQNEPIIQGSAYQVPQGASCFGGLFKSMRFDGRTDATGLLGLNWKFFADGYQVIFK